MLDKPAPERGFFADSRDRHERRKAFEARREAEALAMAETPVPSARSLDEYLRNQTERVISPRGPGPASLSRQLAIDSVMSEAGSPLEKMLAAHVLACSSGAMELFELGALASPRLKAAYLGLAAKLSRTMAQLIDTIDRHGSER